MVVVVRNVRYCTVRISSTVLAVLWWMYTGIFSGFWIRDRGGNLFTVSRREGGEDWQWWCSVVGVYSGWVV